VAEAEDELDYHYICFVQKKDSIYQLDGMHAGPVRLQSTSKSSFLQVLISLFFTFCSLFVLLKFCI
jgi:hypothetical protein